MKTWFIALPLVCMVSLAMAAGPEKHQPPGQVQAGTIHHKARHKGHHGMHKHGARHFPKRDRRACLELKDNKAIIRCAESNHKR
ncbi:MAG: hypothetical protein WBX11_05050 [Thiobacillaceae bacterium]